MTPVEVEAALVSHYLHTGGPSGAAPLSTIDATEAELHEALGTETFDQSINVLRSSCGGEDSVADVLEHGWYGYNAWPNRNTPGFLRYLVLTCAVVASADSNRDTHDFGRNLQKLFNTQRSFGQRSGLPGMWQALAKWCNERHAIGEPIRQVRLPSPGAGIHIGLTNAISFPSWRDVQRLRSDFEHKPELAASIRAPQDAARNICYLIRKEADYREQMVEAAQEFYSLYISQASLLHLHRFWTVVCRAANLVRPRQKPISTLIRIELVFGVDTTLRFAFTNSDGIERDSPYPAFTDQLEQAIVQLRGWLNPSAERWLKMFNDGAVAFVQERFGVWVASNREPNGSEAFLYLVNTHRIPRLAQHLSGKIKNVTTHWNLVGPIEPIRAAVVHRALGIVIGSGISYELPMRVDGGVKTKAGWLGRQHVLPHVTREGIGELTLRPDKDGLTAVKLEKIDQIWFRVVGVRPLDGLYRLKLEEHGQGKAVLAAETNVRFTADAPEHPKLGLPSGRWESQPEFIKAACDVLENPVAIASLDPYEVVYDWGSGFDDLLEVVYALGQRGWPESELVTAIRELVPGPSPWDVIRGLYESGWLEKRVHETWKASSWWLVSPCLVTVPTYDGNIVMLKGSAPAILRHRFEMTACKLGFTVERRKGVGPASPQTLIASGSCFKKLAAELDWKLMPANTAVPMSAPKCWPEYNITAQQHSLNKTWDWTNGRFFEKPTNLEDSVHLAWWRREGGDRADVFTVDKNRTRFTTTSRVVALAEAFRQMAASMFEQVDGYIVRLPTEGHMPLHLAQTFHIAALVASGPVKVEGRWRYAYTPTQQAIELVDRCLGPWFIRRDGPSVTSSDVDRMASYALGRARHRNERFVASFRQ